jgi:hypothetical protein
MTERIPLWYIRPGVPLLRPRFRIPSTGPVPVTYDVPDRKPAEPETARVLPFVPRKRRR